jgi:hypothetical protein
MDLMRFVSVLALVVVISSCGGSEAPPESAPKAEAPPAANLCNLLTSEEISDVMGTAPGEPAADSDGCAWPSSGGGEPLVEVSVSRSSLKSYDDFVAEYGREFGGENPSKEYYQPVEGLGDWGLYRTSGDVLEVHSGDRMLAVIVRPASRENAEALAGKALPRLP